MVGPGWGQHGGADTAGGECSGQASRTWHFPFSPSGAKFQQESLSHSLSA